jgi:hypothetical protein
MLYYWLEKKRGGRFVKRILKSFVVLLTSIVIVGCSSEREILKSDIVTDYSLDIEVENEIISQEDYEKYNDILDYLQENLDKSEAVLFTELETVYDEPASELMDFMNENMEKAIAYDFAEDRIKRSDIEDFTKEFFYENVNDISLLDMDDDRITLQLTGQRALVTGEFLYDNEHFLYVMKMEFNKGFQQVSIFELRLNDVEIVFD